MEGIRRRPSEPEPEYPSIFSRLRKSNKSDCGLHIAEVLSLFSGRASIAREIGHEDGVKHPSTIMDDGQRLSLKSYGALMCTACCCFVCLGDPRNVAFHGRILFGAAGE